MYKILFTLTFSCLLLFSSVASAACLYGTAMYRSGSKIDGTSKVSTSWSGKKAFPRNGEYRLCFDRNPDYKITVYLDGMTYAKVHVNGDTRLDIIKR